MLILVMNRDSALTEVKSQPESYHLRSVKKKPSSQRLIKTPAKRLVTKRPTIGIARSGSPIAAPSIAPTPVPAPPVITPIPTTALADCGGTNTNSPANTVPTCVLQQPVLSTHPTGERVIETPAFLYTGPLIGYPSVSQQPVPQVPPSPSL